MIELYGNLGVRTTDAASPSTAAARGGVFAAETVVRQGRHGTWNHAKRNLGPAIAATHRKSATPLVELGEVAVFVACDRAAAMTGMVANLTGGEIVD